MLYVFMAGGDKIMIIKRSLPIGVYNYIEIYDSDLYMYFNNKYSHKFKDVEKLLKSVYKNNRHNKEIISIWEDRYNKKILSESLFIEPELVLKEPLRNLCNSCGILLNTIGTCPVCDDGEEDY